MRIEDIHPVSEHRTYLTEHLRHVKTTGRPILITQNGRPAGILISPDKYEELARYEQLRQDVAAIRDGLREAEAGKGIDARVARRQIAGTLGLIVDR